MQNLIKHLSITAPQQCCWKMKRTMMSSYFINFRYYLKCKMFQIDHKCNAPTTNVTSLLVAQCLLFLFLVKICTNKLPGLLFVEGNTSQT